MYSGFSKGRGLEMYCEWNQIHLEDTIAFGDNENDNSLLLTSGWGVCLKTAIQTQRHWPTILLTTIVLMVV